MVVMTKAGGFWMRQAFMVLLLANLAEVQGGKGRGVQRVSRNSEHQGFYLGLSLHVLLDHRFEGVGKRPVDSCLEDLGMVSMKKQDLLYIQYDFNDGHVCIRKENFKERTKPLTT